MVVLEVNGAPQYMQAARVGAFAREHTSQVNNSSGVKLFSLTSRSASASSNPVPSTSAICFSVGDYTMRDGHSGEFS